MTYTITSPLYYVNDKPHLGSTYTTIICDVISRFKRLSREEVTFITGVDEHGLKIQRTANSKSISPQEHCDNVSNLYKETWKQWNISYDKYIRTSQPNHQLTVNEFFKRVESNGDIYISRQEGWYCVGCEEYKDTSSQEGVPVCDIHQKPLEWKDENNLFFRLSRYQEEIERLVSSNEFIYPETRRNEVINFVKQGLHDFSISRINVPWGLSVPGYKEHTFYVWFDALLGYITALFPIDQPAELTILSEVGWPVDVHVIGKDILRFHAVYWPAMLMSAKLPLPNMLMAHGFLTREGQKMGKSLGNVLDPNELIEDYGADAIRWYLLKDINLGQDGDFQLERFKALINNDLANTIGNLLNRTTTMSRKWFNNKVPKIIDADTLLQNGSEISTKYITSYLNNMNSLKINKACENILELATSANVYLSDRSPWSMIKDPKNKNQVAQDIYFVLECCRLVGLMLLPILPDLGNKILNQLNVQLSDNNFIDDLKFGSLISDSSLPEPSPIYSKLE